jgi:hypothetical protein
MCGCHRPPKCYRSLFIGEALVGERVEVLHLNDHENVVTHRQVVESRFPLRHLYSRFGHQNLSAISHRQKDVIGQSSKSWCLVGATILSSALSPAQQTQATAPPRPDEEVIVETAMLSLFTNADWIDPGWKKGDVVLIKPKWWTRGRLSYTQQLRGELPEPPKPPKRMSAHDLKLTAELTDLIRAGGGDATDPRPVPDLRSMRLDPRLAVGAMEPKKWQFTWLPGRRFVSGLKPRKTVRVPFTLSPPSFSANKGYAVLVGSAPWSMHGADIIFILQRKNAGWRVVKVVPKFYV